jgi:GntR family transcriptional regulator
MPRETAHSKLASRLRDAVQEGEYDDGRPLPTETQLAETHSVSRQTVRRAMQDLVAEGLVYRVAGRGTFPVAARGPVIRHRQLGSIEDLMALSLDTAFELISPLELRVDVEAASRLRLDSDSVMTLSLRWVNGDFPFCFTTITLPPRIGEKLVDVPELTTPGRRSQVTVIGIIEARALRSIRYAEQSVSATVGPDFAVAHLNCLPGEPVLRIDRLYFDSVGAPIELVVSYFDSRHYSYRIKLHRR